MQRLKVLIVGAGVAGLTCAGLLEKEGIELQIIERETKEKFNKSGYMLGLLPLGGRVLNALNLKEKYFQKSIQMDSYEIHKPNGEMIKNYPLDFINNNYGSYRGISRENLIELLLESIKTSQIKYDTTISELIQKDNSVEIIFNNSNRETYDIVIIAEGIHSTTRKLLLTKDEYEYYDTGWGGWVTWLDQEPISKYREYWGTGSFLGMYPIKDKIGIFLGGPVKKIKAAGLEAFVKQTSEKLKPEFKLPKKAISKFLQEESPFFWEFHDCKTATWQVGNVILLGDAATGFLPTAGVGASIAMDSAAALVDELTRVDKEHIQYGLKLFVNRQKSRVEKAQKDSRSLGKMMFINSSFLTFIRNEILPLYSLQKMLKDLSRVMEGV